MTEDELRALAQHEAHLRYTGDVDVETGEPVDDWGYAESERRAFVAGAAWARGAL